MTNSDAVSLLMNSQYYEQGYKQGVSDVLDKIRAEVKEKIEQEEFARSVFRGEEKDAVNAEQCTGSIFAYNNVIRLIDEYRAEMRNKE